MYRRTRKILWLVVLIAPAWMLGCLFLAAVFFDWPRVERWCRWQKDGMEKLLS